MDRRRIENLIARWQDFADRHKAPDGLKINPDLKTVELLAEGVLNNEDNHGFKYCPCRLATGKPEADARLVCPCNFKGQKTWAEKGECWCSLFAKK